MLATGLDVENSVQAAVNGHQFNEINNGKISIEGAEYDPLVITSQQLTECSNLIRRINQTNN